MKPGVTFKDNSSPMPFPIVGIGASAGGLDAFKRFLTELPQEFGFAVVFIQHLLAKQKSLLPDLLRYRKPNIEINEISDGMEILPGRIYPSPPGKNILIKKGKFHVTARREAHLCLPVDDFLESLADEAGERSIAVILSGAGTDGARGIQSIRRMGGTVFVQDPETAEFPGMPAAAIKTGQVDRVLTPEDICREIIKMRTGVIAVSPDSLISGPVLDVVYRLVHEKTGFRFDHFKKSVVARRIGRRMYLLNVPTLQVYARLLAERDTETAMLAADLMIGVTSFFRDRLAWKALKLDVVRKIVAENMDTPIRVWTPACATGEEAFSIAMMLCHEIDLAGKKRELQVFATDVNEKALEKARDGTYPGSISADVPADYMKKFFIYSEDRLSANISKEIRETVVFAKQDLLTDPPFSKLDLIICRNLLIYLEPEAQEKCISLFHYALKDGGYLFLGNAESVGSKSALFKSLSHKKCRIFRKIGTRPSSRLPIAVPLAAERAPSPPVRRALTEECRQTVTGVVQEALLEEYAPAAVGINQTYDILYHSGPTNKFLRQPRGAPTQNLLELVPENLRSRIRGAIYRATQESKPVSIRASVLNDDDRKRQVTLRISKLRENLFIILFLEKGGIEQAAAASSETSAVDETAIRQIENELSATRADLQSHIEQLKSLNEELQSSNEELQAANEELETSREELQSLNEELITVNSQLQSKIEEQEETNNDLTNFLTSTNIPTLFLDHQFKVRRFTPAMSKLLKFIPSDIGRPIMDMSQENLGPDLVLDAQNVLDNLTPLKKDVRINGAWYVRAALPYRTFDNRIEGVVITYNDVTEIKNTEERAKHLASFPQLDPNPVLEIDSAGKIIFVNPAALKILESLGMSKEDVNAFLPADMDHIIKNWDGKEETVLNCEVFIRDMVFSETVYLAPQFGVTRIYAYDITERKRAEDAIIRAKEEWERTFDSVPDLIAILDNQHKIVRVNQAMARRLGLKPADCIGLPCHKAVHGTSVPPAFCPHSRTVEDGREHIEEIHEDSLGGDFVVSTTPLHDEQGRMLGSVHVAHDITQRKKAEEALKKAHDELEIRVQERTRELVKVNEELEIEVAERKHAEEIAKTERQRLYDVLETLPVYVVLLTPDYHVPFANKFFRERFGQSHGKRCFEYLFGRDEPCEICETYSVLKNNAPHHWEWTGPDGRNYDIYDFPFIDADGSTLILEMGIDITEIKKAQAAVQAERKRLFDVLETLPAMICLLTSDYHVSFANRSFREKFGESGSRHCYEYCFGRTGPCDFCESFKVLETGQPHHWEVTTPDGSVIDVHDFPFTDVDGTPMILEMDMDITDRKRAEKALKELNETLEQRVAKRTAELAASEEQFRRAVEGAPIPVIMHAEDGQVLQISRTWTELTGYAPEDMSTFEAWLNRAYGEGADAVRQHVQELFKGRKSTINIEFPIITCAGQTRHWSFSASAPGTLADGRRYIVGMVLDITDRKKAEEQIAREKYLQQLLLDHFPGVALLLRTTTREIVASNQAGRDVGAVCGSKCFETWGQSQVPCPWCLAEDLWATGKEQYAVIEEGGKAFEAHWVPVSGDLYMHYAFDITDRKQAEKVLQEKEQLIEQALSIGRSFTFDWDVATDQVRRSTSCRKIFGIDGDDIVNTTFKRFLQHVHPDDRLRLEKVFRNLTPAAETYTADFRLVLSDGSVITLEETAQAFFDAAGEMKRVIGVAADITERRHAEEALRASSERYRSYIEVTGQLGWTTTPDGEVVEDLPSWRAYTGQTYDEMKGWGWAKALHPDDQEYAKQIWKKAVTEKGTYEVEYRLRRHDGIYRHFMARGVPVFKEDESVLEWVGTCIDITERKQMEEALRESEQRLARSQEIAHLGSWELDLIKNELNWSDEVYRLFGLKPQEFGATYEAFLDRVHPDDRAAVDAAYSGSIREGKDAYEIEHRVVRKDTGEIRWVLERCQHVRDDTGKVICSLGMVHDITDRKKSEEELQKLTEELKRSNSDLQQFAYIASHDLQSPLRNIEGFVKMLVRRYKGQIDEKADEFIHYISTGVKDMQTIILDILEYSKVGSDGRTFSKIDTSLCVAKAISNLNDAIAEKNAGITYDEPFPVVFGDSVQLTSLFQNLIGNAIKFCTQTPNVHLSVKEEGREYIFSVRDNGIGINPEDSDKIFAVFHRLHSKSEYPGTGIGLAICNKIVERHDGRMWVESQPGKGSTFYFTLPIMK